MSIILDALKKSENERRRRDRPGIADLPVATPRSHTPAWALLAMGMLASLVLVLTVAFWRLQHSSAVLPPQPDDDFPPTADMQLRRDALPDSSHGHDDDMLAEHGPADRGIRPLAREVTPAPVASPSTTTRGPTQPAPAPERTAAGLADLPSLDELSARGELTLPDLHMDLHVYATDPAQRFVFINGRRLRHGDALSADLKVLEILADGVVLQHGSTRFVLPRD